MRGAHCLISNWESWVRVLSLWYIKTPTKTERGNRDQQNSHQVSVVFIGPILNEIQPFKNSNIYIEIKSHNRGPLSEIHTSLTKFSSF